MPTKTEAPLQAGKYRLSRVLAHTPLCTTYLVTDTQANRQVIILKFSLDTLPAGAVAAAVQELRALAQRRHPHLLGMDQVFARQKKVYVISEDEVCETLADLVRRQGPLAPEQALALTDALADAVAFWHDQGRVHADLHSGNVLITAAGEVRLGPPLLAGLAMPEEPAGAAGYAPRDPSLLFYRAPEIVAGSTPTTCSDQYALAALGYEMLTGRSCYAALRPPSAWNSQLPTWMDRVLLRALSPEPEDRYASVAEFREALALPQLADQWVPATKLAAPTWGERVSRLAASPARRTLLAVLGVLLLAALLGLLRGVLAG